MPTPLILILTGLLNPLPPEMAWNTRTLHSPTGTVLKPMVPSEVLSALFVPTKSPALTSPSVTGLCGPSQASHKLTVAEVHTAVDRACEMSLLAQAPILPLRLQLLLQMAILPLPWLPT